jgi:hypothetical protein
MCRNINSYMCICIYEQGGQGDMGGRLTVCLLDFGRAKNMRATSYNSLIDSNPATISASKPTLKVELDLDTRVMFTGQQCI